MTFLLSFTATCMGKLGYGWSLRSSWHTRMAVVAATIDCISTQISYRAFEAEGVISSRYNRIRDFSGEGDPIEISAD